jgi:hypothetical protein
MTKIVKEPHVSIDNFRPGTKKFPIEWELLDDFNVGTYSHFKVGCGCTADVKIVGNKVVAKYSDSATTKNPQPVTKNIRLYLKSDLPKEIKDGATGATIQNPAVPHQVLTFTINYATTNQK